MDCIINNTTVFIDPRSTINYSSFYIRGLYDFFGKKKVFFSPEYFNDLKEIDMLMAFVTVYKDERKKYIIDYRDQNDLIGNAYDWSDVYAKINVHASTQKRDIFNKVVNIPPSFGIKIWNPVELLFHVCDNFIKAKIFRYFKSANIHLRPQRWIRNYLTLLKRQKLEHYAQNKPVKDNYVFFVSTLWLGNNHANSSRYQYILSCGQNQKISFEGGFFINKKLWHSTAVPDSIPQKLRYYKYISNKIYLKNIQKSIFVFNSPAVANCHGWKLGEFLCMGKAILSMPLINELPVALEHDKHIYFVKDEKDIERAVALLTDDKELRHKLEKNARSYYENYASPVKVIEQICGTCFT
jgi:hypothetical protein